MNSFTNTFLKIEDHVSRAVFAGFFIYLASIFFIDSSRQATFFYLCVALPALIIIRHARGFFSYSRLPAALTLVFIVYLISSALWSGLGSSTVMEAAKYGLYLFCLMLAVQETCNRLSSHHIAHIVGLLGGIALCLYAVFLLKQDLSFWLPRRATLQLISGWGEDNPISSAVILGVPVLAAWVCFPQQKRTLQVGLFVLILLGFGLMFMTKSRGPIMALATTIFMLCCYRRSRADIILGAAFLTAAMGAVYSVDLFELIRTRAEQPNYRLEIWSSALDLIAEKWAFGYGYGHKANIEFGRTTATHAHSTLLEVIRIGGILGGALLLGTICYVARDSFKRKVNIFFALWLLYGILCLSSNGRMLLSRPNIEWFSFWLPLFFLLFCDRDKNLVAKKDE